MSLRKLKFKILHFLWIESPVTTEVMVGLISFVVAGLLLLSNPLDPHNGIAELASDHPAMILLCGIGLVLLGIGKVWAWLYSHVELRRILALLGGMMWTFLAVMQSTHSPSIFFTALFGIFAGADTLIYLRLRFQNGGRTVQ